MYLIDKLRIIADEGKINSESVDVRLLESLNFVRVKRFQDINEENLFPKVSLTDFGKRALRHYYLIYYIKIPTRNFLKTLKEAI